ncbi:heparin lyase I family protein [Myxosarcina sp. GI1]|uniref:heparin lyase I family protein n=1 Tax=Myxosarcina sp. GI1 TaxID=1541065 RepID=UPI00055FF410|nr:heparin lyase I family protein [Myxosarcina sp. GI1]
MRISKFLLFPLAIALLPVGNSSTDLILNQTFDEGKYESIYRQYQNHQCSQDPEYLNNSLFKFVSYPVRGGKLAMQHNTKNCDERSELGINPGLLKAGEEYWIGWSYFIPENFNQSRSGKPDYTIVHQMFYGASFRDQRSGETLFECNQKSTRNGKLTTRGSPGSHMSISPQGDRFEYGLTFYKGRDSQGRYIFGCKNIAIPARLNEWEDFVMHIKPSSDPQEGFVKIWQNGKLYVDEKVALLRPGVNIMGAWKIGIYVGDPGHGERLLYTDELRVGNKNSSFKKVSPKDY